MKEDSTEQCPSDIEYAIDACGDAVLRLATCRLRNKADAEDVFQTVFLKLFQRNAEFSSTEHLKAWLLRVTLNCCTDLHRSSWVQTRAPLNEVRDAKEEVPDQSPPFLQEALDRLPEKQRVAIHLFYFEGYSTEETARLMHENPATTRSHLCRARKTLKITLGGSDE
ncbi:MAG: sigma-70 family RNA polymerase sigma factor [Raoultibacter sp.]